MSVQKVLLAALVSLSFMTYAANDVYTIVGPLEGRAVVGKEVSFKVSYKWLTDRDRTGKIFYKVNGTSCQGEANVDKHRGLLPVAGEAEIKCTFDKSAVFQSDTVLQLYEEDVAKEVSEHQTGNIIVTAE